VLDRNKNCDDTIFGGKKAGFKVNEYNFTNTQTNEMVKNMEAFISLVPPYLYEKE
jgi:hypothetical protein